MKNEGYGEELFRSVFDTIPSLLFIVDRDVRIQEYNAAAAPLLAGNRSSIIRRRAGEVMHCLHSMDAPKGCGQGSACSNCRIRNAVRQAFQGNRSVRLRVRLELIQNGVKTEMYAMISAAPFRFRNQSLVLLTIEDISEIAKLRQIISICAVCKKVRNGEESWQQLEAYFKEVWGVDFSHGLCPDCFKREMGKLDRSGKS